MTWLALGGGGGVCFRARSAIVWELTTAGTLNFFSNLISFMPFSPPQAWGLKVN